MIRSQARQLDQFYTDPPVAAKLVDLLLSHMRAQQKPAGSFRFLEPSAGEGAFFDALERLAPNASIEGCDLDPKHSKLRRGDFFKLYQAPPEGPWVVFGNPPFGKNAMLAVRFFNHAALFADTIAFIVPRTFEKASLKNRLDSHFSLNLEVPLDPNSFHFDGSKVAVPCVFQVWERLPGGAHRPSIPTPTTHPDFRFLKMPEGASFAFQRVGVKAGRTKSLDAAHLAPPSHYFIAPRAGLNGNMLRKILDSVDWAPIKARTAGNPSISKSELIEAYNQRMSGTKLA